MDESLRNASREIGSEIGTDIAYFTPPEEKRFIGEALMVFAGGALLYGFFKGFCGKLGEKVGGHLGSKLGDYVNDRIDEIMGWDAPDQEKALADAKQETDRRLAAAGLSQDQVRLIASEVETALAGALSTRAPDDVSARIARKVAAEGAKVL
jgi:hypothetical protein